MQHQYNPHAIEPKWQAYWEAEQTFRTPTDLAVLRQRPKFYILDMFPYPSAAGLHVGHPEGYTATDVIARMKRMQGFNVLHPMGWDAFGLPAERAAVRENQHPAAITQRNVDNFRRQIKRLGFSYDWSREVSTADPAYYRWTQWIFLKLYECGLAYRAEVPVNWCPALGTVLANEEVKDGRYVETGDPVERRLMQQWMLKITVYAERLLADLDEVDWPEGVKEMQRNWIGKSTGADIIFAVSDPRDPSRGNHSPLPLGRGLGEGESLSFTVFTTRPDTLFGCTYCVLAPEHPLVAHITTPAQRAAVEAYVATSRQKTDLQRTDLARDKTGVFTGAHAVHPVTGAPLPIWVADYVLLSYGSGAIMAVPAHDERDHAFATAYQLPIIEVITGGTRPIHEAAHPGDGVAVNSTFLDGLPVEAAKQKMIEWLVAQGKGAERVHYRLRDWLFSRQRYWGEPFPILHSDDGSLVPVSADDLPVTLPPIDEYRPTADGQPPLARAAATWREVPLPNGRVGVRETNTMPQWAGSCWYYLRFLDPHNTAAPWSAEAEQYWMPVDLYVGGVEHAVLHLLYARFWHKVLYDCRLVHTKEPFQKLFNQGMILAYSYRDAKGKYYHPREVEQRSNQSVLRATGEALDAQIEKMSKSKQNVVSPDEVIDQYGADAMRLYELFMGPLEQVKPWQMDGVEGVNRFLGRVWRLIVDEQTGAVAARVVEAPGASEPALWKLLHQTIQKVTDDTLAMRFNTAIAQMMIFLNAASGVARLPRASAATFVQLVAPYAPHVAEELWQRLGETASIAHAAWPVADPAVCADERVTVAVQVNGRRRDAIEVEKTADAETVKRLAMTDKVTAAIGSASVARVVYVPQRIVNIVLQ